MSANLVDDISNDMTLRILSRFSGSNPTYSAHFSSVHPGDVD